MVANLWCTRVFAPVPFLIFYELDEGDRRIAFVIITETPYFICGQPPHQAIAMQLSSQHQWVLI